ncbi:ATP-binding protein [Paraburkholderia rhizosphaerae]|nr:ATP-binding protein [Paraburkholderia rhizosphaerae]
MSERLLREVTQSVHRELNHFVGSTERAVTRLSNELVQRNVPLGDPQAVARELYASLNKGADGDWLFFGNESGGLVSAGTLTDHSTVFLMTDDFRAGVIREFEALPAGRVGKLRKSGDTVDFRGKVWYQRAKETRKRQWTGVYMGAIEPVLGMSLAAPVFDKDGNFVGVCGTDVLLTQLSEFLQTLEVSQNGRVFIIDASGQLVGASGGVSPITFDSDGKQKRVRAPDAADPIVRETAGFLDRHPELTHLSAPGPRIFSFSAPKIGRVYAAVDHIQIPVDWIVVSALPASDFLGPVYRAASLSIGIGSVLVVFLVVVGSLVVKRILRPLGTLTQTAQAVARGEWGDIPEIRRNDEIGLLARAFTLMTVRLKETLEGLRRSEAKLEDAQRVAHVGYWERNLDTKTVTWSDETYRIFGITPGADPLTPATILDRIHPEDRPKWINAVAKAIDGTCLYDIEYRVIRPTGEVRIVSSRGDLKRDETGAARSLFGTVQDVSEQRRAEGALRDMQTELAHANRVATMGQLTASIAHEVKQPISAAAVNAAAALRWLDAQPANLQQVRQALDRIVNDAMRAGDIIGRIRELIAKVPPHKDEVDINDAMREVIELTRAEAAKQGVSVHVELGKDLPRVYGDRVQLQQVMLNLIINAIEAMSATDKAPRDLLISTGLDSTQSVLIAVADSGPGLPSDAIEQIFDPFYTTKASGLGMGLSICHSIVEAHGGRITARSNVFCGAVFELALPVHPCSTIGPDAADVRSNEGLRPQKQKGHD